jgi:hypothetical protein
LTAWVLPVLGHQWQDRQRAREIQAALVMKVGRTTTDAIVTSQVLVSGRLPHTRVGGFDQKAFNEIDVGWQRARAEIEAEIEAYFPADVRRRWRRYSEFVRNTYWLTTDRCFQRDATVDNIRKIVPRRLGRDVEKLRNPFTILDAPPCPTRAIAARGVPKREINRAARRAYYFASREVLNAKVQVTGAILHNHLAGFSTRPLDGLRDLMPGI